ncbi:hypothetical protein ES703_23385 [subsurface metagenome]
MKILNSPPKFLIYAVFRALRHPRTPITYYYCSGCKIRFSASAKECPKCHDKVGSSPDPRQESPVPWWGSILCIVIGIGTWVVSATLNIVPLGEAARLLVYAPVGHLFGMSLRR